MTSTEGHDCWENCDEGPHGCVCGNDCEPPRSTLERMGGRQLIPAEHLALTNAHQAIALHVEAVLKTLDDAGADFETLALTIAKPQGLEARVGGGLVVHFSALPLPPERRVT